MRLTYSLSALVSFVALVAGSNVVDLDPKNFDQYVGGSKGALVEFFAPWCGHCKNLAPTYEQLADAFPSDKVVIAKTDADGVGKDLGQRYGVSGFPTLKWFPAGSQEPEDYNGGRDLDALAEFVAKQSGVKSKIKPPPPPASVQVDAGNFNEVVLDESKTVLIAFTAPWCGHCKNMKPAYEQLARNFASESDCVVAQINADEADNKGLARLYNAGSYPTIKVFPKGPLEPGDEINYNGARDIQAFTDLLNEHCGTSRSAEGGLSEKAGRVLTLDRLAYDFFTADVPSRGQVVQQAKAALIDVTGHANKTAEYYVKAMERIVDKGEGWLVKEQARLAGLLGSPSLAPTKLDELKIKANILASFTATKIEEAYDATTEKVGEMADDIKAFAEHVKEQGAKVGERIKSEL